VYSDYTEHNILGWGGGG